MDAGDGGIVVADGHRTAAELRLWDAIDQQRLCPFLYFGIHDGLDFTEVPWRRGHGYDVAALSNVYTSNDAWARQVIQEVSRLADDPSTMRALAVCVSVEHAKFMAAHITAHRIPAVAVWGDSPPAERVAALQELAAGRIRVVFSVDLFNAGVDVPTVDTLLLLRPSESPTLFLQQLGRGLRRAAHKNACTVMDFVGTHRREFCFDLRYRALLGGTRREVERAVQQGFPRTPTCGCRAFWRSPGWTCPTSPTVTVAGPTSAPLRACRCGPRACRRSRCAKPSAGCCTSTTTSGSGSTATSSTRRTRRG